MKSLLFALSLSLSSASLLIAQPVQTIGGEKIVTITRTAVSKTVPEFTSVTVLPGRGMELLYISANFPGKGEIPVLLTPDLATAARQLDEQDTPTGNNGYMIGAALIAPYANRIGGIVSADGQTVTVNWHEKTMTLPANSPVRPGQSAHAMHGLMLKSKATGIKVTQDKSGAKVTGIIHAGDFGGHWLSSTDLEVTIELTADAVDTTVVAKNVGKEDEPMAIGWHPWLNMPSGARDQIRVQIPGSSMDEMGADRMPTGKIIPVAGTRFDFQPAGGRTLDSDSYDVNLTNLQWANGVLSVCVTDPAAHYGVRLEGFSPEMKSIQMASPVGKSVVAIEHQYNFADPFSKIWGSMDTGMVTLKPGKSTTWHVRLHVFVP